MRDYRKIRAWQLADDCAVAVYEATKRFPREEVYGLTTQLRRAVVSVASNIVEGAARSTKKDYLHFLCMSRGSLSEVQYQLHLAVRLGFVEGKDVEAAQSLVTECFRALHGLVVAVESET